MNITEIGKVCMKDGSQILVGSKYVDGLKALEGFGHLVVVWWADKVDEPELRETLTVERPYKGGPDQVGIFATRSPVRPNPICISVVDVLDIDYKKGIITTSWIDAEECTPILDLKAYFPCSDKVNHTEMPEWARKLPVCIEDSAEYDWSQFFNF